MSPLTPSVLTPQQKKNQDVIEAGRGAYRMVIPVNGNPHSKQPYRDLWDKGWRLERRKDEASQRIHSPREESRAPFKPVGKPDARYPKRNDHRNAQHSSVPRTATGRTVEGGSPVITDRLVERFNRRHQTRA